VGIDDGLCEGEVDNALGTSDSLNDGEMLGLTDGLVLEKKDGFELGLDEGLKLGPTLCEDEGDDVG